MINIDNFQIIKSETNSPLTYILYSSKTNPPNWVILKITESSSNTTIEFADTSNNPTYLTNDFERAWNDRDSLNYSLYYNL